PSPRPGRRRHRREDLQEHGHGAAPLRRHLCPARRPRLRADLHGPGPARHHRLRAPGRAHRGLAAPRSAEPGLRLLRGQPRLVRPRPRGRPVEGSDPGRPRPSARTAPAAARRGLPPREHGRRRGRHRAPAGPLSELRRGHRGPRRAPHAPAAREGARVPDQVSGSRPVRDGRRNDPGRRRGRRRAQARGPLRARLGLLRDHAGDRGRGTHDHGPRPARARPAPDLPRERRGVGARPRARGGKIRPLMKARQLAALLAREASVFLLFAVWAMVVTRPLAFRITTHTLPGPDPLSHLWMVNWLTGHAFQPGQIFHGNIFSPAPHAALMTDLSLGTAVLVLPLRLFVTEPLVLFNLATLIALAFGGWAFHALVFGLTRQRWAGLLAAFSPEQLAHVFHLNLLSIGWLALFVLGLHRIVERPSVGAVLLTGVSGALSAQSSGYYAVSAAALALVFVAFHARS